MPPRRPPRPTPVDVDALRTALGQGKIVRVGIAPSDQFPDGVTGRVRRMGDPTIDGDEFLFVEVPVGGSKDVLPFAPKDLTSAPVRKLVAAPSAPTGTPRPAATPRPVGLAPAPALPAEPRAVSVAGPPRVQAAGDEPSPAPNMKPAARAAVPKLAATASRGKRPPVTITISTAGDESAAWRIEARIGVKPAVRPTVIPPSRVWEIVQSLAEPKLTEVVQTLLEDHRRSTQARADALAAELSSLRAELDSFPDS